MEDGETCLISRALKKPLRSRWSTLILYVVVILVTLPLIPMIWVPIRDGIGPPATTALSTVLGLGGAWVLLKVMRVLTLRKGWSPLRGLALGVSALVFSFFLWLLENPVEKVHFFQYGFLSFLAYHCIGTTWQGLGIWPLRTATVGLAASVGLLDEAIQYLLPNRFGDIRDVGFNLVAGVMGLVITTLLQDNRPRERFADGTC